ncbi:MAG: transglycosylase SLT domain-containing protein [Desulfurivibrionaceae bacterium]
MHINFRGKIATASLLAVLAAAPVQAAMYKFVDEHGVIHFTNVPSDPKYQPVNGSARRGALIVTADPALDHDAFDAAIHAAASRYQVDPRLVKSVIRAESNFNYLAVSRKGAQGLMQLMPETAGDMQVLDPFDPQDNINGGTRYLRKMLGLFNGNLRLALAAYNAGPTRVAELGRVPRFKETENYVQRVQLFYEEYKKQPPLY